MRDFLRDTWLWILIPFVVLALAVGAFLWLGQDGDTPFLYTIY